MKPSPDSPEFIESAVEGLRQQTAAHAATWHFGGEPDWSADLEAGTIRFTFADGTSATAVVNVVGTCNTLDGTLLRGWDRPWSS